jgi:hypothetical protein
LRRAIFSVAWRLALKASTFLLVTVEVVVQRFPADFVPDALSSVLPPEDHNTANSRRFSDHSTRRGRRAHTRFRMKL